MAQEQTSGLQSLLNGATDNFTLTGVTAGNLLVLAVATYNDPLGGPPVISDDNTNSWTTVTGVLCAGTSSTQRVDLFYVQNANSGDTVVTVTPADGTGNYCQWAVVEWSGMETTGALDKSGSDSATAGDAAVTQSAQTSQAASVSFAAMTQSSSDTDIAATLSGYTVIGYEANSNDVAFHFAYKVNTVAATESPAWAHDNTAQAGWGAVIGTFNESASTNTNRDPGAGSMTATGYIPSVDVSGAVGDNTIIIIPTGPALS